MAMDNFSQSVEEAIEARGVAPRPRWHFLFKRSVFWSLALASIFFGAIAFSIADYIFFDNEGVSSAVLLESPLEGIMQSVPLLWLVVFGLFAGVTFVSFRNTRSGYQHRTTAVVLTVTALTIGLGFILNMFDFGQGVHYYLLNHTSFYDAMVQSSDDFE